MKTTITRILMAALASSMLLAGGCAPPIHARPAHGEATRAWFEAQQRAAENEATGTLDSEEAAAIYGVYRRMLRGTSTSRRVDDSPVLLLREGRDERGR